MDNFKPVLIAFLIGLVCIFGGVLGSKISDFNWRSKAIEQNCGQFNPKTGDFEWMSK